MIDFKNLKYGTKLRLRNGEIASFLSFSKNEFHPYPVRMNFENGHRSSATIDGRFFSNDEISEYDIIEVVK